MRLRAKAYFVRYPIVEGRIAPPGACDCCLECGTCGARNAMFLSVGVPSVEALSGPMDDYYYGMSICGECGHGPCCDHFRFDAAGLEALLSLEGATVAR